MTILRLCQSRETPATQLRLPGCTVTWAYSRAPDAQACGERGQDFVAIDPDSRRLTFALCDGVSQSFFGDVAARFLGEALVTSLWQQQRAIEPWLNELREAATAIVGGVALPAQVPPLVQQVLEGKRALGSESMFVAGALDLEHDICLLAWLGDSRLRVWDHHGEQTEALGNGGLDSTERWSSRRGVVGRVHQVSINAARVSRIVAYSDGLADLDRSDVRFECGQVLDCAIASAVARSGDDGALVVLDLAY